MFKQGASSSSPSLNNPDDSSSDEEDNVEEGWQGDNGEFITDEEMDEKIKTLSGQSVFRACSATCIESAVLDMCTRLKELAKRGGEQKVTIWFMTDGEETAYLVGNDHGGVAKGVRGGKVWGDPNGRMASIPASRTNSLFEYFNVEKGMGCTTGYQDHLCWLLRFFFFPTKFLFPFLFPFFLSYPNNHNSTTLIEIAEYPIQTDFHICHLGDAHPLFLQAVRETTDGHFHALVDVGNVREEMEARAMSGGGTRKLVVQGLVSGGEISLATAVCENEREGEKMLMARGELPYSFREDLSPSSSSGGLTIVLPSQAGERVLAKTERVCLPSDLMGAVSRILSLEPRLEGLLTVLQEDISASSMAKTSRSLVDLRYERNDAVKTIGQFLRKKARFVLGVKFGGGFIQFFFS